MNAVRGYLDELLHSKESDSQKSFRFSVTVTEEEKNRLEHVANELGVSRAEFAAELMISALVEAEIHLGLRPKDDNDLADYANWSEKKIDYVKKFLPVFHFMAQHSSGEISYEEFRKQVTSDSNGNLVLRGE